MVVSIDKATALRMHDKVQTHWQAERVRVEAELSRLTADATTADPDRLRPRNTVAAAGVAGGSSTLASISLA